ncbi:hypothetical protein MRX96_029508 [Rhipicephalus microplus]
MSKQQTCDVAPKNSTESSTERRSVSWQRDHTVVSIFTHANLTRPCRPAIGLPLKDQRTTESATVSPANNYITHGRNCCLRVVGPSWRSRCAHRQPSVQPCGVVNVCYVARTGTSRVTF